jgi:hypothetical protein
MVHIPGKGKHKVGAVVSIIDKDYAKLAVILLQISVWF